MVCVASGFDVKSIIALWPMRGRFGSGTDYDLLFTYRKKKNSEKPDPEIKAYPPSSLGAKR